MAFIVSTHSSHPQSRHIQQAADILKKGGIIALPTDAAYVLACRIGDKAALEKIRTIRQLEDEHYFTLMCRDLSDLSTYAEVNNSAYRILKALTPGAFTFLLAATRDVPRRLLHPKRKTVGLRIPANKICLALLEELAEPMLVATLNLPGSKWPLTDPEDMQAALSKWVDLIIDGGCGSLEGTTIIDLTAPVPDILRQGLGDASGAF